MVASSATTGSVAALQKRKRNRVPLSCTICRKRKVKCDKGRPQCQQCIKTGVGHLCHYMEQSWAEEAEKELSKEQELKQLRERVKSLEDTLSKVHAGTATNGSSTAASSNTTPIMNSCLSAGTNSGSCNGRKTQCDASDVRSPILSPEETQQELDEHKYDNDELDLTRQFDMLHLKNNGTVHLGATHWLAIMKGDPYLKLLWGHIFTLREKLAEWYSQKRKPGGLSTSTGSCPVIHGTTEQSKCPVAHTGKSNSMMQSNLPAGHCPVMHNTNKNTAAPSKCPIDHQNLGDKSSFSRCPIAPSILAAEVSTKPSVCPIYQGNASITDSNTEVKSRDKLPALPSFQNLTAKCPVMRDSTPTPTTPDLGSTSKHPSIAVTEMSSEQAIDAIVNALPTKNVVWSFLDKFFNHIYPVVPILDELNFKQQINQILQTKNEEVSIKLTKQSDSCILGILLIILRITWLSLPPNACKVDLGPDCETLKLERISTATVTQAKEESMLLKYEIPIETIEIVRKFLIKFDEVSSFANSNVNITTVQFAIFYKLYLMCSPDKTNDPQQNTFTSTGQDNETHQVLLSSIVQMAFSCGLHRDPDNFPQLNTSANGSKLNKEAVNNTERLKHTWRKTWFYVVSLDVQQSLSLGTPRLLRNLNDFSDTKLPCASKIDYVNDIKELIVVKNYTLFFQIDLCIISVLNHILNVSLAKTVRKFELDQLIKSLSSLRDGLTATNDVVNELVNKGLLFTSEGTALLDQSADNSYSLPAMHSVFPSSYAKPLDEKETKINLAHEMTTRALFFSKHITISMLQYLLNYVLFTHYEPLASRDTGTRSLAKGYAQGALNFAMEGFNNCVLFYNSTGSNNMFSYMDVLLSHTCLDVGHRALQFIVCLILRAKCGPLSGMGESPAIGTQNNNPSSSSEDEVDQSKKEQSPASSTLQATISLDAGDNLAHLLLKRMVLFHKLAKQVSVKYSYAKRMAKSTGFFITLLKKPSSKSKTGSKNKGLPPLNQHPNIENMTSFFKNVPSLVLSAGGDQIRRCPVYQDAVGFLPSKVARGTFSSPIQSNASNANHGIAQQLPPLNIQYQPVTFRESISRTSDVRGTSEPNKRRKTDICRHLPTEIKVEVEGNSVPPSPAPILAVTPVESRLPQLDRMSNVPTAGPSFSPGPNTNSSQPQFIVPSNAPRLEFTSPAPTSDLSSIAHSPDFEDFLSEHKSLNGLMINPSSIVEAVGFDAYSGNALLGSEVDFLPLDNNDGMNDLNSLSEFPVWDT